jgi:non-ribosomal peptide synthetase component F
MEIPLTPMEFTRRARRLYANREAVVDGELRLTYAQFFERCDRWSAVLQAMGIRKGDRVAYIAPNTHAHLEAYYAVPQIGAVSRMGASIVYQTARLTKFATETADDDQSAGCGNGHLPDNARGVSSLDDDHHAKIWLPRSAFRSSLKHGREFSCFFLAPMARRPPTPHVDSGG